MRNIAAIAMVMGFVMLGLPVGIVATAFAEEIHRREFVVTWSMVASVPLFASLDASSIAEIMRFLRAQEVPAGTMIVRRGEPAHSMYFIAAGEVEIELPPMMRKTSESAPKVETPVAPSRSDLPPLAPLERQMRKRLARRSASIDARIDLHGKTQHEAHRALLHFLHRAQDRSAKVVLVITGKGTSGDSERGVLKRQVPMWLSQPDLRDYVIGFDTAHISHGGEGALYVRIRKAL